MGASVPAGLKDFLMHNRPDGRHLSFIQVYPQTDRHPHETNVAWECFLSEGSDAMDRGQWTHIEPFAPGTVEKHGVHMGTFSARLIQPAAARKQGQTTSQPEPEPQPQPEPEPEPLSVLLPALHPPPLPA